MKHLSTIFMLQLLVAFVIVVSIFNLSLATVHDVNISSFQFSPPNVTVNDGDTVRWHWTGGLHSTTSDVGSTKSWDSGLRTSGDYDTVFTAADGPGPFPYHCRQHVSMHGSISKTTSAVELVDEGGLPGSFSVDQNYPNPFNPTTTIKFSLEKNSSVTFQVYNIAGQSVEEEDLGPLQPGVYSINWDVSQKHGKFLPSGVYFYRLRAGEMTETKKMILLK